MTMEVAIQTLTQEYPILSRGETFGPYYEINPEYHASQQPMISLYNLGFIYWSIQWHDFLTTLKLSLYPTLDSAPLAVVVPYKYRKQRR